MADITTYMPGDILFYSALQGNISDQIISEWTASPIIHVAIAVSAVQKIEALNAGVIKSPIDARSIYKDWLYHDKASPIVPNNLARAIAWLDTQVGQLYGWGDIINAALARWEHNVSLTIGDHYDCSGLATEFLLLAGGVPQLAGVNPHEVTPAKLDELLNSH